MPVAAAIAGAAVIGGATSLIAGSKAAKAQKNAAAQEIGEQRRQYDTTRADYAPWRAAGETALARITADMTDPTHSAFTTSPGYQFRLNEGVKAAERSAAARGLLKSGASMKAIQRYGEGLAASEYGDWWNRNAGVAGVGERATGSTTQAGQFATGNIGNAYQQAGNARASSYANAGSAVNSGINNVLSAYLYSRSGGFGA